MIWFSSASITELDNDLVHRVRLSFMEVGFGFRSQSSSVLLWSSVCFQSAKVCYRTRLLLFVSSSVYYRTRLLLDPFSTEFGLLSNSVLAFRSKERDLVIVLVPRVLSLPLSRCRDWTLGMRLGPSDRLSQEMLYEWFIFGVIFICAAKKR